MACNDATSAPFPVNQLVLLWLPQNQPDTIWKRAHAYNFCGSFSSEVIAWMHNKNPLWQIAKDLAASPKPKYTRASKYT